MILLKQVPHNVPVDLSVLVQATLAVIVAQRLAPAPGC